MKIGRKLQSLRTEKGYSIPQVAGLLDISDSTYRKYETDKSFPDVFKLDKIAKIYDKKFTDLLPDGFVVINTNNGEHSNNAGNIIIENPSEKLMEVYIEQNTLLKEQNQDLKEQLKFWKEKGNGNM